MSDWTRRLSKVQANVATPVEEEPIGHLSLQDLKAMPMSFGKAHVGKSFLEIWQTEPGWIKWFLGHYASSSKTEHRKMIRFIHLMIEESEKETPQPSAKSLARVLPAKPKSVAAPVIPQEMSEEPGLEMFEMMSEAPWVAASENREEIQALQSRMLSLEATMQQMLSMMQAAMPMTRPSTSSPPETAAEWENPWDA
eukprot:s77_g22.t1